MRNMNSKTPELVIRIGSVAASIFAHDVEHDSGKKVVHSVNLQKRYKAGDETRYSSSFGLAELPQAIQVLQFAMETIRNPEAVVSSKGQSLLNRSADESIGE